MRDATTRVFRQDDGSLLVDAYSSPVHYRAPDEWRPISNELTPDPTRPGWVATTDNEWTVSFGSADEGMRLSLGSDSVSVSPIASDGRIAPSAPTVRSARRPAASSALASSDEVLAEDSVAEPSEVTYRNVWPGADLHYEVSSSGVKEEIVVAQPSAGSEFVFDVRGVELVPRGDGGLAIAGALGERFEIPPPTVVAADGSDATATSKARYELRAGDPESVRLAVVVDEQWLQSLSASDLPVHIDPTFSLVNPASVRTYTNTGSVSTTQPISTGRHGSTGVLYRSAAYFDQYEDFLTGGWRVYNAMLQLSGHNHDTSPPISVYDQGPQPFGFSVIGTNRPLAEEEWFGPFVIVSKAMDRWVTEGLENQWFGFRGVESGSTLQSNTVRLVLAIFQPPQPSFVTNISDDQVLATTTPMLQSQPVPFIPDEPEPEKPWHEFQITTSPAPNSGLVLSSGTIEQTSETQGTSWTVPQGALQDGLTYWAWVLTHLNQFEPGAPAAPTEPPVSFGRKFTVDLGLGDGGPSPTDEVGSVPGGASSPSEGAPSPSLPASKVTINLVDGNLSMSVGTKMLGTLSGGLALGFTYNSLTTGNQGLRAEFFNDTNGSGAIDAGDVMVGQRVDPTVSFDWGPGILGKAVAAQDHTRALGRWTGFLTVPSSGTWEVGAISSEGLRATVNGTLRLDRWATHEPEDAPVFGTSFAASPATPVPISIEWRNEGGWAVARVFLRDVTNPSLPVTYNLSPGWVTQAPQVLPHGWLLNAAAGQGRWVGLADRGTSVSVFAADGSTHDFKRRDDGTYEPPLSAPNDLLTLGDEGRFIVQDAAGSTYTFRAQGDLESLVTSGDDVNPAALSYGYSGSPAKLRTITDPVSGQAVTLIYGGETGCTSVPTAALGLLCRVEFWDGTATTLTYDSAGRFVRLTNPGEIVHDFKYDPDGALIEVRDPLAYDAIAAAVRADDATARTQIHYDGAGRVSTIIQPAPTAGAPQPQRTYTYDPVNRTGEVDVAGFAPSVGFAQRVRYDSRLRIVESTGSDGLSSMYAWDSLDRVVAVTDAAGLRTTTVYDHASRPVVTYGPAPVSSFDANGVPLPGVSVPTTMREYDGGIVGLAAVYWDNPFLAGGPVLHETGLGADGSMARDWGSVPPVVPGPGGWSARYTGYLLVETADDYTFRIATRGSQVRLWVDEQLVVDHEGTEPASGWASTTGDPVNLAAGLHRVRADMVDTSGPAGLEVGFPGGGGGGPGTPTAALVVGEAGSLTAGDAAIESRLQGLGLAVTVVDDDAGAATGFSTVVLAPSTQPASVGVKYRDSTSPVLDLAADSWVDNAMSTDAPSTKNGSTLYVLSPATHPAAGGLSTGNHTTTTATAPHRVVGSSDVGAGAVKVLRAGSLDARAGGWAYETGALRADSTAAPARRYALGFSDAAVAVLAADGGILFDAASQWATDLSQTPGSGLVDPLAGELLSPNYGLLTRETDPDGLVTATEYEDPAAGIGPHHRLATATIADPDGLALRTSITYEPPGVGSFLRRVARSLPAGNTWTTTNYGGTEGPIEAVCGVAAGTPQGGQPKRIAGPDPDGAGPGSARVEEFIYDSVGRRVGRRVATLATLASTGWQCTGYDARGRMTSQSWPAHDAAPARTTTYTYAVGGNPLINAVTDTTWGSSSVTATVDLLGRTVSYTDIWGHTTTTVFDQAGRVTDTTSPAGTRTQHYDPATGRPSTTLINGIPTASAAYEPATGRLSQVAYANGTSTGHGYDSFGRPDRIEVTDNGGVTGDRVTRSLSGRVIDQQVGTGSGFVDANPVGDNYTYDSAGRLADAFVPGAGYAYDYGAAAGCPAPGAGRNTNRTSITVTGVGAEATSSCYNHADQLVSTTDIPAGGIVYDDHGNTTQLGDHSFAYDSADRHIATATDTKVSSYRRDPLDRIVERTDTVPMDHVATTTASATGNVVTVDRPAGTQAGDVIVASVAATRGGLFGNPGAVTAPGWTLVDDQAYSRTRAYVLYRYATASDPADWAFTVASANNVTVALTAYRGVMPVVPVEAAGTETNSRGTTHNLATVTTTGDLRRLVSVVGLRGDVTTTAPAVTTTRASVAAGASLLVVDRDQPLPGTSPALTATSSANAPSAAVTVAFVPLPTVHRYAHVAHNDNPQFTTNILGVITDITVPLAGNTTLTWINGVFAYNHANLHGDTVTITDASGDRLWVGHTGPYGEPVTGPPTNTSVPGTAWAWHGQQQRLTDGDIVHMGARPYTPAHGRFLTVDPIEGGCANDYAYVFGDPANSSDISGKGPWDWVKDNILTCDDTAASRLITLGSVIPEFRTTRATTRNRGVTYDSSFLNTTRLHDPTAAAWALYAAGNLETYNLTQLGKAIGSSALTKASLGWTIVGTVYVLGRSLFC